MNHVYQLLEQEIEKLSIQITACEIPIDKVELIGQKIEIEHALKLLHKCEAAGVLAGGIFTKLPAPQVETSDYRLVEDGESDNPVHWFEVNIDSKAYGKLYLKEGDVVIEL